MSQEIETTVTIDQAIELSRSIADLYHVQSYTVDRPEPGNIRFVGQFICSLPECFDELRSRFEAHGFTPFIREEQDQVYLIAVPVVFAPKPSNWKINLALLIATIGSLYFVGGVLYAASLLLILGAHELGHYFAARHHKVPVSLPYFIPFPLPPIGTMGAAILLKAPVKRAIGDGISSHLIPSVTVPLQMILARKKCKET